MFEALRLPRPGGISQALGRLKDSGYVVRRTTGGSWSVTPEGNERVGTLVGQVDVSAVEAELATSGSAELDVIKTTRDALKSHGLHLHLASDRQADDELFGNIAAHMWACKYGIALFETRFGSEFNDNLQIEVGAMLMTGRRVALLKDRDTRDMPTDFVGQIYKSADFDDPDAVQEEVHRWAARDLGLGDCPDCPRE
jgi:hypothetical protein